MKVKPLFKTTYFNFFSVSNDTDLELPFVTDGGYICPSNNSWQYAMDNTYWNAANDQYMTNCISSLPSQSPLVVLDIDGLNPDGSGKTDFNFPGYYYQHTGINSTELIWYAPYSDTECDHCTNATSYGRNSEDFTILEQIADGTILLLNDRPEERLLVMQEQLFKLLHSQPDLLANSNSLQQFLYNNQWTNLDFIHYAGQLLAENNIEMLETLLGFWPGQDGLDETYYQYFEWMVAKYYDPEWQPDEQIVLEYANRCPLTHGTIVYAYRNLYNAITDKINNFEDNCENQQARGTSTQKRFIRLKQPANKQEPVTQNSLLKLYPNPARNLVNINCNKIKIVTIADITGRIIQTIQGSNTNNMQLNVAGWQKGVYLITVSSTNGTTETKKLVIQ